MPAFRTSAIQAILKFKVKNVAVLQWEGGVRANREDGYRRLI